MKTVHVPLQAGPKWAALSEAGVLCAAFYIVFGIIAPAILYATSGFDAGSDGREVLNFIEAHRAWWIAEQTLVLAPSVFAIVTVIALYPALERSNATPSLIAGRSWPLQTVLSRGTPLSVRVKQSWPYRSYCSQS